MNDTLTRPSRPTSPTSDPRDTTSELDPRAVADLVAGLSAPQPNLSPKYFYDALGSKLFSAITLLPWYYPTRAERSLLAEHAGPIAGTLGTGITLIELGSGSSSKVRFLLDALQAPNAYVPVDIDAVTLHQTAEELQAAYPDIPIRPRAGDFTRNFQLPPGTRRVVFYPGSTIGNLEPDERMLFLRRLADQLAPGEGMLIGFDLVKAERLLHDAYNDPIGVTAAFNKNMLAHLNRVAGAGFDLTAWEHEAWFDTERSCITMALRAVRPTQVSAGGRSWHFDAGARIRTERSYKFTVEGFAQVAGQAGLQQGQVWTGGGFALGWYVKG